VTGGKPDSQAVHSFACELMLPAALQTTVREALVGKVADRIDERRKQVREYCEERDLMLRRLYELALITDPHEFEAAQTKFLKAARVFSASAAEDQLKAANLVSRIITPDEVVLAGLYSATLVLSTSTEDMKANARKRLEELGLGD